MIDTFHPDEPYYKLDSNDNKGIKIVTPDEGKVHVDWGVATNRYIPAGLYSQ